MCLTTQRPIEQDIPFWEHKPYRDRLSLTEGDGPIMRYRQWRQFYPKE